MFVRKTRRLLILSMTMFLLLFISACNNTKESSGTSTKQSGSGQSSSDGNVVKIGQILTLSGGGATYGLPEKNGAELLIEELNKDGVEIGGKNYKFKLVTYDDGGQGNQTVNLVKRLVEEDKVNIITGGTVSDAVIAAAPTVDSYKGDVIFIASAVSSNKVSLNHPNVFTTYYDSSKTGEFVAEWVIKNKKLKKFGILREKIETSSLYADAWKEGIKNQGAKLTAEEFFDTGTTNLSTQVTNILSTKPEMIIVAGYGDAGPLAIKQLRQQGFKGPISVYGGTIPNAVAKGVLTKEDVEGTIEGDPALVPQLVELKDEKAIEFKKQYEDKFGNIGITANMQRDGIQLLINAMKVAGTTTDVKKITEALRNGKAEDLNQNLIVVNKPFEDGAMFGQKDKNVVKKRMAIMEYKDGKPTLADLMK